MKDNLDGEIFAFSDFSDIVLPGEPICMNMPLFAVCTSGKARVRVNLSEYEVRPGMMLTILSDHIVHDYSMSDDFEGMFLCVSKTAIERLSLDLHTLLPYVLNFKSSPLIELAPEEVASLSTQFKALRAKIKNSNGYYDRKIIACLLHVLLYELLNIYHKQHRYVSTRRSRSEVIFYQFVEILERDYKMERSVAHYADLLSITPKHLSAVVKEVSGKTAGEWIDDYVMLSAKVLLTSTSKTIKEVSLELNFSTQSFFGRFFQQHASMSPKRFREMMSTNKQSKED